MDAATLHQKSIVFDGHCDTLLAALDGERKLGERSSEGHVDLPRLHEGGVTAQVFAMYVEAEYLPAGASRQTLRMLDVLFGELEANADSFVLATGAGDIEKAKTAGQVAAVIGMEGAEALEGDLGLLRVFHRLGLRLLTVAWSRRNQAADGVSESRTGGGLTTFGEQLVRECNRLGIILDISHLAAAGVRDVLELSTRPVIASHSNAYALCSHPRNLTDEQLDALAKKGGVVGVTFVPAFIAEEGKGANLDKLLDHIDHIVGVIGTDHVGLGSDFDGLGPRAPEGLEDVTCLPGITAGLIGRGYSAEDVRNILGGNLMRVFRQVVG
ncbi:MAG TPA: dipeptidase [Anaerolineae bacterium]|nr:dipeptidase [Anaerolineae bacterium]